MTLVFTNGCFDIIHDGHIHLLEYAKSLGDRLIVGINSDWSCQRLKGPTRPIFSEETRCKILKAIKYVDDVIIFKQDTPDNLIQDLKPEVLVKGPEANNAPIPGAEFVLSYGGKVIVPNWEVEVSTTKILKKILEAERPLPTECLISIEDKNLVREEITRAQLMLNAQPDGIRPVLYFDGRRVIKPYSINISYSSPKDMHGRSG